MVTALIDADIIAWRSAGSCEPTKLKPEREPLEEAIWRCDDLFERILADTECDNYKAFLSGTENFRYVLYPEYKANRKNKPQPLWLNDVKQHLVKNWNCDITEGYEADDAIGMNAHGDFIVCSIDKDLTQIEGRHYNFVQNRMFEMDEESAARVVYYLLMVGDTSDNIQGVGGIGKTKAPRIIEQYQDIDRLHEYVKDLYGDDERFQINLRLLRVLRSEEEWQAMQRLLNEIQEQPRRTILEGDEV
jgi:DNA polymerase-1